MSERFTTFLFRRIQNDDPIKAAVVGGSRAVRQMCERMDSLRIVGNSGLPDSVMEMWIWMVLFVVRSLLCRFSNLSKQNGVSLGTVEHWGHGFSRIRLIEFMRNYTRHSITLFTITLGVKWINCFLYIVRFYRLGLERCWANAILIIYQL